jgi:hypothetical protein
MWGLISYRVNRVTVALFRGKGIEGCGVSNVDEVAINQDCHIPTHAESEDQWLIDYRDNPWVSLSFKK